MNLNLNLAKFWKNIKEWSVGRMIALLVLLGLILKPYNFTQCLGLRFIFIILLVAILLEIFELSHNKLGCIKNCKNIYAISMVLSLLAIIGFSMYFLYSLVN